MKSFRGPKKIRERMNYLDYKTLIACDIWKEAWKFYLVHGKFHKKLKFVSYFQIMYAVWKNFVKAPGCSQIFMHTEFFIQNVKTCKKVSGLTVDCIHAGLGHFFNEWSSFLDFRERSQFHRQGWSIIRCSWFGLYVPIEASNHSGLP